MAEKLKTNSLVGDYNHWSILSNNGNKGTVRCNLCGNIWENKILSDIRSGKSKSCYECRKKTIGIQPGETFNNLVFLRRTEYNKGIFKCNLCGSENEYYIDSVKSVKSNICKLCTSYLYNGVRFKSLKALYDKHFSTYCSYNVFCNVVRKYGFDSITPAFLKTYVKNQEMHIMNLTKQNERKDKVYKNKQDEAFKIVRYGNTNDIDVEFTDGTKRKHITWKDIKAKTVPKVSRKDISKVRLGEQSKANCNLWMIIIAYRGAFNVGIKFEDGYIVKDVQYYNFKKGSISHPKYGYNKINNLVGKYSGWEILDNIGSNKGTAKCLHCGRIYKNKKI